MTSSSEVDQKLQALRFRKDTPNLAAREYHGLHHLLTGQKNQEIERLLAMKEKTQHITEPEKVRQMTDNLIYRAALKGLEYELDDEGN